MPTPSTPSLHDAYVAKFGSTVRKPGIIKKTSIVRTERRLAYLLNQYIDDSIKSDDRDIDETSSNYGEDIIDGLAPQREGIDFFRASPGVHVFGHMRACIQDHYSNAASLPQEQVIQSLVNWWTRATANQNKKAYHIVFSLHPRISHALAEKQMPDDSILLSIVTHTLVAFGSRFHPGACLSWVIGFHHDRHHSHAHALIYPKTSRGVTLNFSKLSAIRTHQGVIRVDFQGELQALYEQRVQKLLETLQLNRAVGAQEFGEQLTEHVAMALIARERRVEMAKGLPEGSQTQKEAAEAAFVEFENVRNAPDRLAMIASMQQRMAEDRSIIPPKKLGGAIPSLEGAASEVANERASLEERTSRMRRFFGERRTHPAGYQLKYYGDGSSCITPNCTYSYLHGESILQGEAPPQLTPDEVWAKIRTMTSSYDEVLKSFDASKDYPVPNADYAMKRARKRTAMALRIVWEISKLREARFGTPRIGSMIDAIRQTRSLCDDELLEVTAEKMAKEIQWVATANRAITQAELIRRDLRMRELHQFHSKFIRKEEAEDAPLDIEALCLPKYTGTIPNILNFVDRSYGTSPAQGLMQIMQGLALLQKQVDAAFHSQFT